MNYTHDILASLPGIILAVAGLIVVLIDAISDDNRSIYWISILAVVGALIFSVRHMMDPIAEAYSGMLLYGGTASFGSSIILFATLFILLITDEYLDHIKHNYGEIYGLILFASAAMIVLAGANNLLTIFLGIETMSICLYIMAGLIKDEKRGAESALKYFLLGAFSTGFLLYGMSLLYGASGSLDLVEIGNLEEKGLLFWAGTSLLLVGLFFKISAVPFHMWTPDVYQGTPTTLTAYMATASKSATFVAFIIVLSRMFPEFTGDLIYVIQFIAIITMILGNLIALVQDNVKRMLAYSSIAHAGYVLVGLATGVGEGYSAVLYYLLAYTIMNVGAFGVVAFYERQKGLDFTDVENYAGLGFKQPLMGVAISIFLFSLAGMPGTVGFIGKYQVFAAAIQSGMVGLTIIGVLASVVSVYYYLRVMVYLYMRDPKEEVELNAPGVKYQFAIVVLVVLTIYLGIAPTNITELLASYYNNAGMALLGSP